MSKGSKHYIITVFGCVEPKIAAGPFSDEHPGFEARFEAKAKKLRAEQDDEDAIFGLIITPLGRPTIYSFSNAFFDSE